MGVFGSDCVPWQGLQLGSSRTVNLIIATGLVAEWQPNVSIVHQPVYLIRAPHVIWIYAQPINSQDSINTDQQSVIGRNVKGRT